MAQKAKTKVKKKRWIPIVAPRIFRESVLGESLVADPAVCVGKTLSQNLMNLTGDMKRQQVNIKFIVTRVQGNKCLTEVIGYRLIPASIKRLTRRRSEKLEMSFVCHTADNKRIKIKPIVVTRSMASNSVVAALRHLSEETVTKAIKKMTYDNLINDLVTHKFQRSLRERLKKIFPIKICEVKYMQIEEEKKPGEEKKAPEEIEVKEVQEAEEEKKEEKEEKETKEEEKKEVKEEKKE